jgi:hypothetical protein
VDKSGFEADCVPNEAMDRVCLCVSATDDTITIRFVEPVQLRTKKFVYELTIPHTHPRYRLQRETVLEQKDVSVESLWENYWLGKWGENVSNVLLHAPRAFKELEEAIKTEGLRAPVIVHRDGTLRGGSHRVMIYKRLGRKTIPAFITDTVGGTL